jgi:hypothetical protein
MDLPACSIATATLRSWSIAAVAFYDAAFRSSGRRTMGLTDFGVTSQSEEKCLKNHYFPPSH